MCLKSQFLRLTLQTRLPTLKIFSAKFECFCCRFDETPVFNMTQAKEMLDITWGEVLEKSRKLFYYNPFEMMLWYPGGNIRTNKFVHNLCVLFLHMIPAYFIDFLMLIFLQNRL